MTTTNAAPAHAIGGRLIETLYTEAMLLADEARSYFDHGGFTEELDPSPITRVGAACESLKLTTRLMQVIAWLLARRGTGPDAGTPDLLGEGVDSDPEIVARMPPAAQALVAHSLDLYARTQRLATAGEAGQATSSPARSLLHRLQRSL